MKETFDIIINNIYKTPTDPAVKVNPNILSIIPQSFQMKSHSMTMYLLYPTRLDLRWGQHLDLLSANST